MIIKNKKKDIFPIFAVLLGVFGAGAFFLSSIGMQNRGGLSIRVVDAYNLTPVKNADIIIPSADIFAETDSHVYKDKLCRAVIYLFPEDKDGEEIITVVEPPDEEWIKALVEKYLN